ncbi:MAG: hypothetical protein KKD92_09680 [Proteobacteria bacterium]|nr:hypothetical protein [Pseudomonadota bacterium]
MDDVNQRAEQDLPALRQWVERLLVLTNRITDNVQYKEDDHIALMALCFLSKQIDHTKSILTLMPSRDVILIARSMIEGLCQLLWAAKDANSLPLQWRTFTWVHDWRVMQAKIALGGFVEPESRAAIQDALKQYGGQFLTNKAIEARNKGASLPADPYHKNWRTGCPIRQIFEAVGGDDLYCKLYEPFSDWQHWGSGGLGEAISWQGNQIVYSSLSPIDTASALAVAIQCLLETVKLVDTHLGLGLTPEISKLHDEYIAWGKSGLEARP